jgi:hypothetical protein
MSAKGQLAEFVMDHLSRNGNPANVSLIAVMSGLTKIFAAFGDAQDRRGNWGPMLDNLRGGIQLIDAALPHLRSNGGPGVADVIEMAEREVSFARDVEADIVRITAGESTLV